MSNKVYGFCDAGCRYRVPTYDEFEKSASLIKIFPNEDGIYHLEAGKKYKIRSNTQSGWGALSISMEWWSEHDTIYHGTIAEELPPEQPFINEVAFGVMGTEIIDDGFAIYTYLNGTIKEHQTYTTEAIYKLVTTVSNAGAVFLINEDAQAKAKDGESITVTDVSESAENGGTNTVTFSDGSQLNVRNGVAGKYDCSSGKQDGDFQAVTYLKITVPNQSTIFDLIVKLDEDGGGCNAGMYDFITWRLHIKGLFCSGQCSTIIQDATQGNCTLHYRADDDYIDIYVGFTGCCIEAYINGILETISATFEKVATLPSDATEFTMK